MSRFLWCVCVLSALAGCRQESTRWDVDLAVPIARGTLAVSDYDGPNLQANDTGLLHLIIDEQFGGVDLSELAAIPDTTVIRTFESPIPLTLEFDPGQEFLTLNEQVQFDVQGADLDEVIAAGGTLSYQLKNYLGGILDVSYALAGITLDGQPVTLEAIIPAETVEGPGVSTGVIDLTDHVIDLTGESGFQHNTLNTVLEVIISGTNPGPVEVNGQDSVSVWLEFLAPEVAYARGYFGQITVELDESVGIDGGLQSSGLMLEQIDLELDLRNYVGIDAQLELTNLSAENSSFSTSTPLEAEAFAGVTNIARAQDYDGWVDPTEYSFLVNTGNSNVNAFIGAVPDSLTLQGTLGVNPLGNVSGHNDFIYTNQTLDARLRADIPLCIATSGLVFTDTLDITSEDTFDAYGQLLVRAANRSTLGAEITLELIDAEGTSLVTFGGPQTLVPGTYDGLSTVATTSTLTFDVPDGASLELAAPNRLLVHASLFTTDAETAKVYEDALLDLVITAVGTTTINGQ